jgi:hypothetical protein
MNFLPSVFNVCVCILLSLLHFYWILGGRKGYGAAMPTDSNGRRIFRRGLPATLVVPLSLLFFSFVNLAFCDLVPLRLPRVWIGYGIIMIGAVFLFRAIGDFRYVGFTKRYRRTRFAKRDTQIYSPLCFVIAVSHFIVALYPVCQ